MKLLKNLKIPNSLPMKLYCENKATINIAYNIIQYDETKYIELIDILFKINLKIDLFAMSYIPIKEHPTDVLTMGLLKRRFDNLICKLRIQDIFKSTYRGVLIDLV